MKIILLLFVINLVIVVRSDTNKGNDRGNARTARNVDTEFMSQAKLQEPMKQMSKRAKPDDEFMRQEKLPGPIKLISKTLTFDCNCREVEEQFEPAKCDCIEPCHCDHSKLTSKAFTKITPQKVTGKLLLRCTPESYYDSIEYEGSFDANVSCNAVRRTCRDNAKEIYYGIKTLPNGKQQVHSLNAWRICETLVTTNGNAIINERAELDVCQCKMDVLTTLSQWVVNDPISGCRGCGPGDGVKEYNAIYFELKIFGKCCSVCRLQYAKVLFDKGIKNH